MTSIYLIMTLGLGLVVARLLLLEGRDVTRLTIYAIVVWVAVAAASLFLSNAHLALYWVIVAVYLSLGSVRLVWDWEAMGQSAADLAHYREVVRQLEERRYENADTGHVARLGGDDAGGNSE